MRHYLPPSLSPTGLFESEKVIRKHELFEELIGIAVRLLMYPRVSICSVSRSEKAPSAFYPFSSTSGHFREGSLLRNALEKSRTPTSLISVR